MREAKLLEEAAELKKEKAREELELVKEQRTREEEKFGSEMRKKKFEDGRAQMLYQLCNKEYLSKFGKDYNMDELISFFVIIGFLQCCGTGPGTPIQPGPPSHLPPRQPLLSPLELKPCRRTQYKLPCLRR